MELKKGLISGIAAGIVLTAISFISMMIIPGISDWYFVVFPEMVSSDAMLTMTLSTIILGLFMGLVYSVINSSIPGDGVRKGINYGIMVWLLAGLMWPIMMIGFAPVYIWITELISGLIIYSITGIVIAIIYEKFK